MLLSAATHEKIRAEIAHFPNPRGALLFALHVARDEVRRARQGRLRRSRRAFRHARRRSRRSRLVLFAVQSAQGRSDQSRSAPGLPCCLNDARGLVRQAEKTLGTKSGTATADGRFAIVEVECLGSCGTAPVVQVNRNPLYRARRRPITWRRCSLRRKPRSMRIRRRLSISQIPDGVEAYLLPPNGQRRLTDRRVQKGRRLPGGRQGRRDGTQGHRRRWSRMRVCADVAVRVSPPASSGRSCRPPTAVRATSPSMPTKVSRAPLRTGRSWSAIRICRSRAS